jgi:hypothetical protein
MKGKLISPVTLSHCICLPLISPEGSMVDYDDTRKNGPVNKPSQPENRPDPAEDQRSFWLGLYDE